MHQNVKRSEETRQVSEKGGSKVGSHETRRGLDHSAPGHRLQGGGEGELTKGGTSGQEAPPSFGVYALIWKCQSVVRGTGKVMRGTA